MVVDNADGPHPQAETIVEPTNLKPRRFSSLDILSERGVWEHLLLATRNCSPKTSIIVRLFSKSGRTCSNRAVPTMAAWAVLAIGVERGRRVCRAARQRSRRANYAIEYVQARSRACTGKSFSHRLRTVVHQRWTCFVPHLPPAHNVGSVADVGMITLSKRQES